MKIRLDQRDVIAACHTLWQAAAASGGVAIVGDAITSKGVDVPGVEQGAGVVAIAVLASAGSLAKGYLLKRLAARRHTTFAKG